MNTDRENYGNNNNTNNKMWYNNFNIVWEKSNLGEFCLPFMFLMKNMPDRQGSLVLKFHSKFHKQQKINILSRFY